MGSLARVNLLKGSALSRANSLVRGFECPIATVKRPSHVEGADMIMKAAMPHWTSSTGQKP